MDNADDDNPGDDSPGNPGTPADDGNGPTLLSIGEFSRLTRISVRMLRHYDAHGVLVPLSVDPWTGYRRYAARQLCEAADVRTLRDVGFGVQAIAELLGVRGLPEWDAALERQRVVLVDALATARQRVQLITALLDQKDTTMTIELRRAEVPAMTVVTLRGTVPTYADEPLLWRRMAPLLKEQGITTTGPCGVIEHDDEYTEHDVDLSVFLPVAAGTSVHGPLQLVHLPARDCLIARVEGPYDQLTRAHDQIGGRMAADGLAPLRDATAGSRAFNVYLTTPDEVGPDALVTDVCQPLA